MAKSLTLHIGMPKTGTTAIQEHLQTLDVCPLKNPPDLILLGETERALRIHRSRWPNNKKEDVLEQLSTSKPQSVISTEFAYICTSPNFVSNLSHSLNDFFDETKVVCYVRHPIDHFTSLVSQKIKAGGSKWENVLQVPDDIYQYEKYLDLWSRHFPASVIDYGSCRADVVDNFCKIAGLPKPSTPPKRTNISLDLAAMELMLLVNACADPKKDAQRRLVAKELEKMTISDQKFVLPAEVKADIINKYGASLRTFSDRWLGGKDLIQTNASHQAEVT